MAGTARLTGVDLARFFALVGMMAAHLAAPLFSPAWVKTVTTGFPSTLFAVVGGFGVTFAAQRYLQRGQTAAAVAATVGRGATVAAIGFALEFLPNDPIAVVLVYFGVAIVCAAPFVAAPSWVLATFAGSLAVLAPNLLAAAKMLGVAPTLSLLSPGATLLTVFLTGTYPALTWLTYLLVGMLLCRWVLAAQASGTLFGVSAWILVGGAAVTAASWAVGQWYLARWIIPHNPGTQPADWWVSMRGQPPTLGWDALFLVSPHSGSTIDILRTGGAAAAVIGACLLVAARWDPVPAVMRPVIGAGSAPLTIYVLHLAATSAALTAAGGLDQFWNPAAPWWINWWLWWQLALALVVGGTLSALHRRGPLETLTSQVARASAEGF